MKKVKDQKAVVEGIQLVKYSKLTLYIFPVVIILTVLICYQGTFNYPFQFDDFVNFVNSDKIHNITYFTHLKTWLDPLSRPLSNLTFSLNYNLNGQDPTYYHVVNVIIHILNGILVFLLTLQITGFFMNKGNFKDRQWFALLTAMLFVSHPIQIQGVTYLVQRMTSMAAFFYILSVYFYGEGRLRHVMVNKLQSAVLFYVLAFLSLIMAFESKPNTASLPFMYLLYEICFIRDKKNKPFWKYILIYTVIVLGAIIIITLAGKLPRETDLISRIDYLLTQFKVIAQYLWMLVIPRGMTIDHDVAVAHRLTPFIALCGLIIPILIYGAIRSFKKNALITFAIGWFLISLSIESSIIPIRDVMFEHRMYLSILGFVLLLVYMGWKFLRPRHTLIYKVVILLIVIVWGSLTIQRNKVWETQESLWLDAAVKSPAKTRPLNMLGHLYLLQNRYQEALNEYIRVVHLDPTNPESYVNQGSALEGMQRYPEAIQSYLTANHMDQNNLFILYNLGKIYIKMRQYDKALMYFNKILEMDKYVPNKLLKVTSKGYEPIMQPDIIWPATVLAMGSIYDNLGDFRQARIMYEKLINIQQTSFQANLKLGKSYLSQNDSKSAIPYLIKAIQLDPSDASSFYYLGNAYINIDNLILAKQYLQKALEINQNYIVALDDLGVVEYENKNYSQAVELWEKSLQLNPTQSDMYALIIDAYKKLGNKERQTFFEYKAKELGYQTKL
jgi:protein O-mannosyl-transferase